MIKLASGKKAYGFYGLNCSQTIENILTKAITSQQLQGIFKANRKGNISTPQKLYNAALKFQTKYYQILARNYQKLVTKTDSISTTSEAKAADEKAKTKVELTDDGIKSTETSSLNIKGKN